MSTIDLHGVKHADVSSLLDKFIWENMQKNKKEVKIITGFSEQMKRIVTDLANEYNMDCYQESMNGGVLILKIN